ncbi:MAG: peptidoglycan-binding domain-containing protein [Thiotrichaceae bacterium]
MNNISKTITTCAALVMFLTGCSQQQVSGDSSQAAGSSQVAGSSQQVAGASQAQQVSPEQVSADCPSCNAPKVEPVADTPPPPKAQVVASGHAHPANKCTNSIRHNHPNGSRSHSHKYSCQGARKGNRWTHGHPANKCTKSIRHTHKSKNSRHNHKYSCSGSSINIHALQRKLKAKGYYKGPIDGVINSQTRSALKRYQKRSK